MEITTANVSNGTAMGDLNGYTLTFVGTEKLYANLLDCSSEAGLAGGAGDPINGNTSNLTTLTKANVEQAVDDIFAAIPAALLDKDDVVIFCGNDTFREYVLALRDANLYHYPVDAANMELVIPGTAIKLIGVNGLNGTDKMFGLSMSNLYLGTDMLNEQDRFELFYAKEADEMRFVVEFKLGVQVAFPDEVVFWKLYVAP